MRFDINICIFNNFFPPERVAVGWDFVYGTGTVFTTVKYVLLRKYVYLKYCLCVVSFHLLWTFDNNLTKASSKQQGQVVREGFREISTIPGKD